MLQIAEKIRGKELVAQDWFSFSNEKPLENNKKTEMEQDMERVDEQYMEHNLEQSEEQCLERPVNGKDRKRNKGNGWINIWNEFWNTQRDEVWFSHLTENTEDRNKMWNKGSKWMNNIWNKIWNSQRNEVCQLMRTARGEMEQDMEKAKGEHNRYME